eukprot:4204299-Amphidinium_carterae.1
MQHGQIAYKTCSNREAAPGYEWLNVEEAGQRRTAAVDVDLFPHWHHKSSCAALKSMVLYT